MALLENMLCNLSSWAPAPAMAAENKDLRVAGMAVLAPTDED